MSVGCEASFERCHFQITAWLYQSCVFVSIILWSETSLRGSGSSTLSTDVFTQYIPVSIVARVGVQTGADQRFSNVSPCSIKASR